MNQQSVPDEADRPAVRRAEDLLDRAGQNIGFFAISTRQRIQQRLPTFRRSPVQPQPEAASSAEGELAPDTKKNVEGTEPPTIHRAEETVDRMGVTIGLVTSIASLRIKQAAARMREDVEDLWVEAQSLRSSKKTPQA
jgi:hypothetical protein